MTISSASLFSNFFIFLIGSCNVSSFLNLSSYCLSSGSTEPLYGSLLLNNLFCRPDGIPNALACSSACFLASC